MIDSDETPPPRRKSVPLASLTSTPPRNVVGSYTCGRKMRGVFVKEPVEWFRQAAGVLRAGLEDKVVTRWKFRLAIGLLCFFLLGAVVSPFCRRYEHPVSSCISASH